MTEDGLGLKEGATTPSSRLRDLVNPKPKDSQSYFTFTRSFPITPKLVIILCWKLLSQIPSLGLPFKFSNVSFFQDLPYTKERTTYIPCLSSTEADWRGRHPNNMSAEDQRKLADFSDHCLLGGKPLGSRLRDRLVFAIHDLTPEQSDRVNVLRLTHCRETICFVSPKCLIRSIEAFEKDRVLFIDFVEGEARCAAVRWSTHSYAIAAIPFAAPYSSNVRCPTPACSPSYEAAACSANGPEHRYIPPWTAGCFSEESTHPRSSTRSGGPIVPITHPRGPIAPITYSQGPVACTRPGPREPIARAHPGRCIAPIIGRCNRRRHH